MASGGVEVPKKLKLYNYWRSSCSYRVRIGLNLKSSLLGWMVCELCGSILTGLSYDYIPVDLAKGEHFSTVQHKQYLEEKFLQCPLLHPDLQKRALHFQAATIVSSNIQPFQNLAVLKYIEEKVCPDETINWVRYHILKGIGALEKLLEDHAGRYATGDEVLLADVFLAPQIDGAITRFDIDMTQFPTLKRCHEAYSEHPAFQNAMPQNQPAFVVRFGRVV